MTDEELKRLVADIAIGNKELQARQQQTDIQIAKMSVEIEKIAAAQQKTEAAQQKTEAAQRKTEAAQQKTEAAQRKTEAALQKTQVALQATQDSLQETQATLQKIAKEYGGFINNQGLQAEDFFFKGLQKRNLEVGDIQFDYILPRQTQQRDGSGIELDALLVNGEYVAFLEVKTKVHLRDVEDVFKKRIPAFRKFFSEYSDKSLLVLMGGNIFNADALAKARSYGFICLTPDNQDLHVESANFHKY